MVVGRLAPHAQSLKRPGRPPGQSLLRVGCGAPRPRESLGLGARPSEPAVCSHCLVSGQGGSDPAALARSNETAKHRGAHLPTGSLPFVFSFVFVRFVRLCAARLFVYF